MPDALWAVIGAVATALISYLSARYTARSTAKAAERSVVAEEQAAVAVSRQVDLAEWKAILAELRRQIDVGERRAEAQQKEIGRLAEHIAVLEGRSLAAIRYARQIIRWARKLRPEANPPVPPEVIAEEF